MSLYIDTSALIACYLPEPLSGKVTGAIRRHGTPVISSLVEVEMASVVAKMLRSRQISRHSAVAALGLFSSHVSAGIYRTISLTPADYLKARHRIAEFAFPLHTLDALHIAVAHTQELTLLTADRQLAKAAGLSGVQTTLVTA